jgi:hypothetical protein
MTIERIHPDGHRVHGDAQRIACRRPETSAQGGENSFG